jgi:hypothetical protein
MPAGPDSIVEVVAKKKVAYGQPERTVKRAGADALGCCGSMER